MVRAKGRNKTKQVVTGRTDTRIIEEQYGMKDLQEVFNKIKDLKKQQKEISTMYRDQLESMQEYQEVKDKLEELKARKKQLENEAWNEVGTKEEFETIKLDIKQDKEMLADLAISSLMKGETVKLTDENDNEYEPIFSVRFKKTNEVDQRPS